MNRRLQLCLNWKVLGALALVGVGIWAVAPHLVLGAIPLLALAACPLSMMLMMRGMQGGACTTREEEKPAEASVAKPVRVADLKAELAALHEEQTALSREIARLESSRREERPAPTSR